MQWTQNSKNVDGDVWGLLMVNFKEEGHELNWFDYVEKRGQLLREGRHSLHSVSGFTLGELWVHFYNTHTKHTEFMFYERKYKY